MDSKELAIAAVQILDRKKADQVHLINISEISTLGDYFVLATGTSGTHVKSLADELEFRLKEKGGKRCPRRRVPLQLLDFARL